MQAQKVEDNIRGGNGWGMPAFQGELTEAEIEALVIYLSGEAEEQPPSEIAAAGLASLYCDNCCDCHGKDRIGGTGPALTPENLSSVDIGFLRETISDGISGTDMPPWKDILTEQEIDNLIEYILSPVE